MPQLSNGTLWSEQFTLESSCSDDANFSLSNCTNLSSLAVPVEKEVLSGLNIPYAVMEALVAIVAVIGNALVIIVFYRERRLRRRTNYYIISLALADFLVGLLGIPFAILVSLKTKLPFPTCADFENSIPNCFFDSTGVNWPAE
jgi:7 transmembrane receptor (rhodopsin family)